MISPKIAIAAASFKRLSPSMIRPSRLGAESERKIPATAEGSVVETTAPISRPVVIGTIPSQLSEPPIITVESTTATTANSTIGTQSSKIRRTSIPM